MIDMSMAKNCRYAMIACAMILSSGFVLGYYWCITELFSITFGEILSHTKFRVVLVASPLYGLLLSCADIYRDGVVFQNRE